MFVYVIPILAMLAIVGADASNPAAAGEPPVRILFLTDCAPYSDWQSIAMVYSYMYSGHKGPITRVMCCSEEDRKKYNPHMLSLVETHVAPSYVFRPLTGDAYLAYNKPGAVIDYMEKVSPPEEWLLVLDSDMQVRHPWHVRDFNLSEGWAIGSEYGYLKGVHNELADRHIPEIPRRNDTFAGPIGRRSDMVGGFFFIHRNDLKRLSTLWLKYAEDVRADPEAYHLTGDVYAVKPGMKPWIAEMYGYSYGAAKANVWHHWDEHSMLYPGYMPGGIPKVLHYGLEWEVQGYQYDKHFYTNFNPFKCPSWDLAQKHPQEGLFPHPPHPKDLKASTLTERYRDLISIEGAATLNAALCFWHRRRCPPSEQLTRECDKAEDIYFATRNALTLAEAHFGCHDMHAECENWAKRGECKSAEFHGYMASTCRPACGYCKPTSTDSENEILRLLSDPKPIRLKPQPITGAGPMFSIGGPDGAADTAGAKGATAGAKVDKPAAVVTEATDSAVGPKTDTVTVTTVPVTVTTGQQGSTTTVTTAATDKQQGQQQQQGAAATTTRSDAAKATDTATVAGTAKTASATAHTKDTQGQVADAQAATQGTPAGTPVTNAKEVPRDSTPAAAPGRATADATTTTTAASGKDAGADAGGAISADATHDATAGDGGSGADVHRIKHPAGNIRALIKRCYHMRAATVEQVKECMAAAKKGQQWEQPVATTRRRTTSDSTSGVAAINAAQANAAHARQATAHLHPADTVIVAAADDQAPVSITAPAPWRLRAVMGHGFGYHILGVWGLLALLYLLPSASCWRRRRTSSRGNSPEARLLRKEHV